MDGSSKFPARQDQDGPKLTGKSIFAPSRLKRKDDAPFPNRAVEGVKLGFSFSGRQFEKPTEVKQEGFSSSSFSDRYKISNVQTSHDGPSIFRPSALSRPGSSFGGGIQSKDSMMKWTKPTEGSMNSMRWTKPKEDRARSNSPSLASATDTSEKDREQVPVARFGGMLPKAKDVSSHISAISVTSDQKAVLSDLVSLRGRHCPSEYDKYVILEERDKLLYKLRSTCDKPGASAFKSNTGFCNSMCSEKERYVREVQKRISPLECSEDGEVDCSKLVKEYARSAADQEKPLPHELRSVHMLQNSMVYLLTKILDEMPSSSDELAGWYDFLWSRTRAIRKEITVLMLSDEIAVALVERCTRLHILCSYLLCGLDVEKFDQRMNTENLAKCLQTLRHLYDDLDHRGIHCPSEAEFRAYDVMLHLHDSNVLRQVLSYRKEVRESRPVRLAIQLACCLQSHNYVRFFRLLRNDGSFLQSCICHRFFNMVRSSALSTVVRASGRNSPYLLAKLTKVLGFDDSTTALETLETFGIFRDESSEDMVVLSKDTFTSDITASWITYSWIDAKSEKRMSQIVFGSDSLPHLSQSVINGSFDEYGAYQNDIILESYLALYRSEVKAAPVSLNINNAALHIAVPFAAAKPVPPTVIAPKFDMEKQSFTKNLSDKILSDTVDIISRSVAMKSLMSARRALAEERAIQQRKQREDMQIVVSQLSSNIVSNVVENLLRRNFNREKKVCYKQYIDERVSSTCEYVWKDVALPFYDDRLRNVVKETIKSEKKTFAKQLDGCRKRMHLLWLKQFWDAWRTRVLEIKKRKERRSTQWAEFDLSANSSFVPDAYISSRRKSNVEISLDCSYVLTELRLVQWRMKRRMRIVRNAFCKWRTFCRKRMLDRRLFESMSSTFCAGISMSRIGQKRRTDQDYSSKPRKYLRRSLDTEPSFSFADPNLTIIHHLPTPDNFNSTALPWHSDVQPDFCHSLSLIDFTRNQQPLEYTVEEIDDTVEDTNYVRRVCGQLDESWVTNSPRQSTNYTLLDQPQNEDPTRSLPVDLAKDIENTRNATENLEVGVLDLEKRMMNHSSLLNDLINKFKTKSYERI